MLNVDRGTLQSFLNTTAPVPSMVASAMKTLEPLCNAAEFNHLVYAQTGAVLADAVKAATSKALGSTVSEARFITLEKPFERPDWMPAGIARTMGNAAMLKLVNDGNSPITFDHALAQMRQPSTVSQGQKILGSRLDACLRASLMTALAPVMRQYIEPLADATVAHLAIRIVTNTLHTYLWQVLSGNQTVFTAMTPTVKLLHELCPWAVLGPAASPIVISLAHKVKQAP